MPDQITGAQAEQPIATATATPAATPPPTPTPPAAPAGKKQPSDLAVGLAKLMTAPAPEPTPKKTEKPAEPKPAATPPVEAKATPKEHSIKKPKTPEPKPTEAQKRPPLPTSEKPATPPAPAAPAPGAKEQNDEEFEKTLIEEERAQLEDARAAERLLGDKYKGHGAKTNAFLRENVKKLELVDKNELDEGEYQTWYKANLPKISPLDHRRIVQEQAREAARQEVEPKLAAEAHTRWAESEAPKVKAKGNEIWNKLATSTLPDEVRTAIAERTKGLTAEADVRAKIAEVQKEYAMEFEITERVNKMATDDLEEFHRVSTINPQTGKPISPFSDSNPVHQRLVKLVGDLCEDFKANGGPALQKDGKWFASRQEIAEMADAVRRGVLPQAEMDKWWTFSREEIVDRALGWAKSAVGNLVKAERDRLERMGFQRKPAAPVTPPSPPPFPLVQTRPGAPAAPRAALPTGAAPSQGFGAQLAAKLSNG